MSEYICISNRGLERNEYEFESWSLQPVDPERILPKLRERCVIEPGTTLLDVFKAIEPYGDLLGLVAAYSWCWSIEEFIAQINEPMRPDDEHSEKIERLVISRSGHIWEGSLDFELDFSGFVSEESPFYSVSATPLYCIADKPVVLNLECKVWESHVHDKPLFTYEMDYTLLEVLDAIFWDISFYGGPAENAELLEELRETSERIERGEERLIPLDDILAELGAEDDE